MAPPFVISSCFNQQMSPHLKLTFNEDFKEVLESLPTVFEKAQFLALDTEFTGLKVGEAPILTCYDTLEGLYYNDLEKVQAFIAIQFGIVAFSYDAESNKYVHHAYNFYTFPSLKSNVSFRCESRTIKFLIDHGFDFNKLFQDGVPYVRESDGQNLLKKLAQKHEKSFQIDDLSNTEISIERQTILDNIKKKIKDALQSGGKISFTTDKYNSYIRRLIYNTVKNEFGEKIFVETNKDESMTISVGFNPDEIKSKENDKYQTEYQEILDEIGFSKVIKLIIESKKLLVGHNIILDLMFTINQCLAPLPDSYEEFKDLVKFLFPKILDTKHMVSTLEFKNIKDTSLHSVAEYLKKMKLFVNVDVDKNGQGYTTESNRLHEAGYDAYVTGVCFLAMAQYLGNLNGCSNVLKVLPDSPFLKPILNKISAPKLLDVNYMNLEGADVEPDRVGVYHLTFPKEWTRENINNLFKDYGFHNLAWINETSAFVKIKKEFVDAVESKLMTENSEYRLCTFKKFESLRRNAYSKKNKSHSNSFLAEIVQNANTNEKNSSNNGTAIQLLSDVHKKRQPEDIGEIVERPSKKHFSV